MPINGYDEKQLAKLGLYFDEEGTPFFYTDSGQKEYCSIPFSTLKIISNQIAPEEELSLTEEERESLNYNFDITFEGDESFYPHFGVKTSTGLTHTQLRHYCTLEHYSNFMSNAWSSIDSTLTQYNNEITKILTITRMKWHLPTTQVDHKGRVIYQKNGEVELDILDKWHIWEDVTSKLTDSIDNLLAAYSDLDLDNNDIRGSMIEIGYVLRDSHSKPQPKKRITLPRAVYLNIKNEMLRRLKGMFKK